MTVNTWKLHVGAEVVDGATTFRVWAPKVRNLSLRLLSGKRAGDHPLKEQEFGYFAATVDGAGAGDRYLYLPDDGPTRPDPASRYQPDGVHEASQVVDPGRFQWQDLGWSGIPLEEYVTYELHVGTVTREGTFAAVIPLLDYLKELGITAVEIMPVAQFPGNRNWGYDGVYPFAPHNSYGGPDGLKQLVDACHRKGLAVVLDVVYNHFGPEGNYLGVYGHYFTSHYRTPWGDAVNFDGPYSDPVREFFIGNALYWLDEFHFDGLRLDAIDKIYDFSARPFMQHLASEVHGQRKRLGRKLYLFAESDLYDARLIRPPEMCGYGIDAQWNDSFHHAVHSLLTGEREGYYEDFGKFSHVVKAFSDSFVFTGNYSLYRKCSHGSPVTDRPTSQFVVFTQNHDQVGNRMKGDRPAAGLPLEKLTLSAATMILSPYLPLLFMGEEFGEKTPFQYFVSFTDPELIDAVRKGRRAEFGAWEWNGEVPDPEGEETFLRSKLDLTVKREGEQALIHRFYRQLLALRKNLPALRIFDRHNIEVIGFEEQKVLVVRRQARQSMVVCLYSFSEQRQDVTVRLPAGEWEKVLDTAAPEWGGRGEVAPRTVTATGAGNAIPVDAFTVVVYYQSLEKSPGGAG